MREIFVVKILARIQLVHGEKGLYEGTQPSSGYWIELDFLRNLFLCKLPISVIPKGLDLTK